MSVYVRKGSPFYWYSLSPPDGGARVQRTTRVRHDAPTPELRKDNKRLAEKVYHEAYTSAVRRREGLEVAPTSTEAFTSFADWYALHIAKHKRGKDRELEILEGLKGHFGRMRLTAITRDQVVEWMTTRRARVAAATVNRELDVLKAVFAAAVPRHLAASPIAGLKRLRPEKRAITVLTHADEQKLLAVLTPPDRAIVIAALDTLIRAGDLLRLDWRHYHGTHLDVPDPKTGKSYKAPVSKRLRRALDEMRKTGSGKGPIFAHRRKAKSPRAWTNSVKQMLEDGCTRAGVTYGRRAGGITFHALRHTGATRMILAGVSPRVVQAIGGWSDLRQLSRYAHPDELALTEAVETVSRPLSRKGGQRRAR